MFPYFTSDNQANGTLAYLIFASQCLLRYVTCCVAETYGLYQFISQTGVLVCRTAWACLRMQTSSVSVTTCYTLRMRSGTMAVSTSYTPGMFPLTVAITYRRTAFLDHICHVIGWCAEKEMIGIDTAPHVAGMADVYTIGDRTVGYFPSYSMSKLTSALQLEKPIASLGVAASRPQPTIAALIDFGPEPFYVFWGKLEGHRKASLSGVTPRLLQERVAFRCPPIIPHVAI